MTAPEEIRRRRAASLRIAPQFHGSRDPLDTLATPSASSTYSLTMRELRAEAGRLTARGWSDAEITERLYLRGVVAA
ncbi:MULTISPECIES: hypothetical protein [Streptomyces]|uniref:Uncharacterized protein n=1 Tax=Streptomyces venezuelae TaxID=54571 RepID=A0A5P2AQC0_STRVZ|nr:hypothetical protein [Streptomyces venezuelae]QES20454.1 hypothetical protein DEJ46_16100 [Streptomyces venezuelae]